MPFLVDSVTMEVNRHGLTLHLIVHPIVAVVRGDDGTLADVAPEEARDARRESFIHVEVDRVVEPARLDALARDVVRVLIRREDGGRRLGKDARPAVGRRRGNRRASAADAAGGAGREQGVPVLARRRALHAPRVPLPRSGRGRRPGRAEDRPRLQPGLPARGRDAAGRDELRGAAAGGPRVRAGPRPADRHQGQRALDRAPTRLSRLCRHQALRRRGQRMRRASLPRPVHVDRVQRQPGGHSAAAPQDGQRRRPGGRRARQPRRQGAAQHPRELSARRAVPDQRGRAAAHGDGHPPSRRAAAVPAVRPARSLRAFSRVPHLRAARELHDRVAREMAGDPARRVQRHELGIQRVPVGVGAGARDDHRAHEPRQDPRVRRPRTGGPARARGAALGRRSQGRADRRAGRGARQRALPSVRRRAARRLPRGFQRPGGGARHRDDGATVRRRIRWA